MPPTATRPAVNAEPAAPRSALTPVDDEPAATARRTNRPIAPPVIELVWEEPPEPTSGGGRAPLRDRLAPVLVAVQERPEQWARIAIYERRSSAGSAAKTLQKKPPAGRWEFRPAATAGGGSALYARWLGD